MKRRIHFLLLGLLAVLLLGQRAQAESPFIVDVWGTADRLPQSSVIAITQTRDGYLWLGTLNGLVRFDGNSLTAFNVNNTPGLPGNGIVFLFEDSHTNLWVGTETAGLCAIQNGVVKNIPAEGAAGIVTAAYEDEAGAVWFATSDRNFFCWRNDVMERQPVMYPAQREFLTRFAFHVIVPKKDGSSWQLQRGRVEKWKGAVREQDFGVCPWGETPVTAACEDSLGNLVVGTRGAGVFWFNPDGSFSHITTAEGLSHNFVLSLCCDREGNLWVGTDTGGFDRLRKRIFNTPTELSGGAALSAAEDAQGGLWAAFNLRGLTYWQTNNPQQYRIGRESRAWSVLVDQQQHVWAGTSGEGLFLFEAGSFKSVPEAAPAGQKIYALFQSRDGKLWVGGENGLGLFDGTRWSFFSTPNGLPKSAVRALAEDTNGVLWIGMETEGLFTLKDGMFRPESPLMKDISCLLVSADNTLWVGSLVHGLSRYANGAWGHFTSTTSGLANDDIGSLAEDGVGNLWIGSFEGLVRIPKKSFEEVQSGAAENLACRTFLTRECSAGAQPAALRARDGKLWFPTIEGLVSVNPADLQPNTNPPPVIIESVLVDGVKLKTNALVSGWTGAVTLPPDHEQLEIHFTALNFSAAKDTRLGTRFKYSLDEVSRNNSMVNFTDVGGERVVHFNRLSPGDYNFHVIACNEDGIWNRTGAWLKITVEPPFWRTPGFIAVSVLVLLGALAGVIYLISTAKLKRELRVLHQKELIEKERARIARDLHDQLGANLTQVTLLGEMAELDKELPAEVEQHAQQICATARETTRSLDEIVWAVNPSNDTLEGLANYACKYAQDYFALAGVSFRADLPADLPPTPILPEVRHNIFLAFKEAVNNVVKHAQATEARVKLSLEPEQFILSITDNGRGLGDISSKKLRNGMKNMRKRLVDVHGEFDIAPGANGGTVVQMRVPISKPKN